MVVGTTLMKLTGAAYYSPSFGRGGNAAVFGCEALIVSSGASLDIDVEHKNVEDTTWASKGSFTTISAVGVSTKDLSGLKEQIRFKYVVNGATATDAVHFNMLAPAWRPY